MSGVPTIVTWDGKPISELPRDQLEAAMTHVVGQLQDLMKQNRKLQMDAIWVLPEEHRVTFRDFLKRR